jgi:hypothetical protein
MEKKLVDDPLWFWRGGENENRKPETYGHRNSRFSWRWWRRDLLQVESIGPLSVGCRNFNADPDQAFPWLVKDEHAREKDQISGFCIGIFACLVLPPTPGAYLYLKTVISLMDEGYGAGPGVRGEIEAHRDHTPLSPLNRSRDRYEEESGQKDRERCRARNS